MWQTMVHRPAIAAIIAGMVLFLCAATSVPAAAAGATAGMTAAPRDKAVQHKQHARHDADKRHRPHKKRLAHRHPRRIHKRLTSEQ
jgi:hypothetical protein